MSIYKPGRPFKYDPSDSKQTPPSSAGEYRIIDSSGNVKYIGETNNLNRRMKEHIKTKKFDIENGDVFSYKIADNRSTSRTRCLHERQKIEQHDPPLNRSSGGEGRPAGK